MITTGQVLPLDGILGDAESDFNERLIKRLTYDGHLWAVPQVIDMYFLVYRKSWLADAGIDPPATVDDLIAAAAELTTGDHSGLFLGNDGGVGPMGGMALWSAGADYLTDDNQFGFANDDVYASFGKLNELYQSDSLLLGAPTDWSDPGAFINELTADPAHRAVDVPGDPGVGDRRRLRHDPVAGAQLDGRRAVAAGRRILLDRERTHEVPRRGQGVREVAVGRQHRRPVGVRPRLRLPHPGPQQPRRAGRAAEVRRRRQRPRGLSAVRLHQTPVLWTPASDQAYSDARTRMIAEGADPAEEIAKVQEVVDSELARLGATATSATVAGGSAPTGTEAMGTEAAGTMAAGTVPATTG